MGKGRSDTGYEKGQAGYRIWERAGRIGTGYEKGQVGYRI